MQFRVSVERKEQALWVTVRGPLSKTKRASRAADDAAARWARERGYRLGVWRRVTDQTSVAGQFVYRACFAFK